MVQPKMTLDPRPQPVCRKTAPAFTLGVSLRSIGQNARYMLSMQRRRQPRSRLCRAARTPSVG